MIKDFSYIVVGSGFFGAVIAERIATDLGEKVLVIEKRSHIGGNCYSEINKETGIEKHNYGTHIFHTDNRVVWEYINRFTEFNTYRHQVLTTHRDKVYQMPINLETINSFYGLNLKPFEVDKFLAEEISKENIKNPENFEEKAISVYGRRLYEAFIKGYSIKQWQKDPFELPESILGRLPFRKNYDESYYFSQWQGIPLDGYAEVFNRMLSHPNITLLKNTDYFDIRQDIQDSAMLIYSGPIDKFFDYKFGALEWRTLEFSEEVLDVRDYQGTAVMNYSDIEIPYTRIHEPKHLHPERKDVYESTKTLIVKERSKRDDGKNPYYPVNDRKNSDIVLQYRKEASKLPNVIISGRLGDYRYYDMHHTISLALEVYEKRIRKGF